MNEDLLHKQIGGTDRHGNVIGSPPRRAGHAVSTRLPGVQRGHPGCAMAEQAVPHYGRDAMNDDLAHYIKAVGLERVRAERAEARLATAIAGLKDVRDFLSPSSSGWAHEANRRIAATLATLGVA